eukprot:GHVQ01018685.1.p1 GENE.GHVQ01018685.1~~GHVQ01018685.1.p1  ORF type:complete len:102 (-),score=3.21 GHVQ01018685.1:101-406(-)
MYRNTEPETMQESICKTISAHESKQKYSDLRFSGKPTESLGIRANSCYLAFPWETGGGGTLALIPRDIFGRITEPLMFKGMQLLLVGSQVASVHFGNISSV